MGNPIEVGNLQHVEGSLLQPPNNPADVFKSDSGLLVPPPDPRLPANPYAPTGWRKKVSVEFDLVVPSGQKCRIRRLERNDMFKLRIIDHLDQLLPLLVDSEGASEDERNAKIAEAVKTNASMIDGIYTVVDIVVMNCCVRPLVTNDADMAIEGTERDWEDPNFISIVHLDDIELEDRMYIFAAAFRREADQLKSVRESQTSVEPVPTSQVVPGTTE